MPKIVFIGAGSTVFAKNLLGDILNYPELAESTISLFDIDEKRLRESEAMAQRVTHILGVKPAIEITTNRRAALDGADYAIAMFQVGGYKPGTVIDFEIPKKYGLRQTIGDTLGIGGIMRGLRTIPVLLDMGREMEKLCPDVMFLNYVNPMVMNTWAVNRATKIKTVGLCHSVPHTAAELAHDIGVPIEEINYMVAGINHMAFYLKFERNGEDLYPLIRRVVDEGRVPEWNRVRYEMFKRLGYFVTESSEHFSEYVPWFIKRDRPDLIEKFNIPLDEYLGRCEAQILAWEYAQKAQHQPEKYTSESLSRELAPIKMMNRSRDWAIDNFNRRAEVSPSVEYGSGIIHSLETSTPRVIYGNVSNEGLIAILFK
jgi:alpha-galactosidase